MISSTGAGQGRTGGSCAAGGVIYSSVLVRSVPRGFEGGAPYVLVWVRLDEGPLALGRLRGRAAAQIAIGQRVSLVPTDQGSPGATTLLFETVP